ncbi:MAG: protein-L-isoaspartate O-methyltransferase [Desulfurococcales archaeon]|nr:protein-L-isoaspartate O-methyltransferase [Desulfurococcales archaeon]
MKVRDFKERRRELVEALVRGGILKNEKVIKAMLAVPREEFVPANYRDYAYNDSPLPIGYGQTISAPHMVAIMTQALDPELGNKVLEVGTGSGYQAAVLAEIVGELGHIWTIERIKELVEFAKNNLGRLSYLKRVTVIHGDGSLGYSAAAPYDRIMVTAAAPEIPGVLLKQLKIGGRLVAPVGNRYFQRLVIVTKESNGKVKQEYSIPCVFVPLVGKYGFKFSEF